MPTVFLIGGGRGDDAVRASHSPFVDAVAGRPIVALALDEGEDIDLDRWTSALTSAGATDVRPVVLSKRRPPTRDDFDGAGGWTPGYPEALVAAGTDGPPPDAGFSAGAAIAGQWAIDEGTTLIYDGERVRVEGLGSAYRVSGTAGDLRPEVERAAA